MFSVVYQDINIFAATIMENITGANPNDVEIKRAKEALAAVGLKEKIESLPKQYDTELLKVIYDDGIELSGGQNQKLAIARALYKNGNIVILDEPTAALDALAEQEIYTSFNLLVKNKTSIFISHRLASTRFCDKIALFSRHGLIEYGTHEELMNLKKEYYHMFMVQGKYYQEAKDE
jgi:ATP-binding cassette subfamily B protein/ATP-binding cassette subfamily C protein